MSKQNQWIVGVNAVASAIENDADNVREVLVEGGSKNARLTEIEENARRKGIDVRRVTGYQDFVDSAPLDLVYVADHARMRLVPLEGEHLTMPTAVFYCTDADDLPPGTWRGTHLDDSLPRTFGRAAVKAYIDGYEGRLMRSMKSILGTALVDQTTEVGNGLGVKYLV